MVVMRMGRRRSRQACRMAASGALPSLRSASRAKSIIMMAFFLTMPMSRMMPIMPTTPSSMPPSMMASKAPTPAEGRVERMVTGWI